MRSVIVIVLLLLALLGSGWVVKVKSGEVAYVKSELLEVSKKLTTARERLEVYKGVEEKRKALSKELMEFKEASSAIVSTYIDEVERLKHVDLQSNALQSNVEVSNVECECMEKAIHLPPELVDVLNNLEREWLH